MVATLLLTFLLLSAPPAEETCRRLETGYDALLAGSFSAERHLTVSKNGVPKLREVAWLSWRDGTLRSDRIHIELLDKKLDTIDPLSDPALDQRFACRRVVAIGGDHYVLHAEDGAGELELLWDAERGILVPVSWRTTTTKRSLFRRVEIETRASYGTFEWRRE